MEERQLLDSWKEISFYLHRSVKTCQRWESDFGMPIHRVDGTPRARVFAYKDELERWLAEGGHRETPRSGSPWLSRLLRAEKFLIPFVSSILLLGLVVLARINFPPSLLPPPANVPSLAILPLANESGDEGLEPLRTALSDLITVDLIQSRFVDVIGTGKLLRSFNTMGLTGIRTFTRDALVAIVEKLDVDYAGTGSLSMSDEEIVAVICIQDPRKAEGGTVLRVNFKPGVSVFSAVDELSNKIKAALGLTSKYIHHDVDRKVADISTASLEAFLLYSQGYRSGNQAAIPLLRKAVEVDPDFGLAYKYLWMFHQNTGRNEEAKQFAQRTLELADRLSGPERLQFEGLFYSDLENDQRDLRRVLRAYQELWTLYPDDDMAADVGGLGLASLYADWEEWGMAIPILEKYLSKRKANWIAIGQLADCYASVGRFEKAAQILSEYLRLNPEAPPVVLRRLGYIHLAGGRFADALACFDKLISGSPNISSFNLDRTYALQAQGSLDDAEKEFQRIIAESSGPLKIRGLLYLSALYLAQGRVEEAKSQARRGIELALQASGSTRNLRFLLAYLHRLSGDLPEALEEAEEACQDIVRDEGLMALRELHLRALITLELGRMEEFETQAEEIRRLVEREQFPRLKRVYFHLLGHRELQRNNVAAAVSYLGRALELLSAWGANDADGDHAKYYYSLVLAREREGRGGSTEELLETIILPTVSRDFSGDMYARAYYFMGRLYEPSGSVFVTSDGEKVRKTRAIESYQRYLSLWGKADPPFASDINDARTRLARLEPR